MGFAGRKKALWANLLVDLWVLSLAHTMVTGDEGYAKEVEELREKVCKYEDMKISYETNVVDFSGKVEVFIVVTIENDRLKKEVDRLTWDKEMFTLS